MKRAKKKNCHQQGLEHAWQYINTFQRNDKKWVMYKKCGRCYELIHEILDKDPREKK